MVNKSLEQAERRLKKLFRGYPDDIMPRDEVLRRVAIGTFYNYGPTFTEFGLALTRKKGNGNKFTSLELTDEGKRVVQEDRDKNDQPPHAEGVHEGKVGGIGVVTQELLGKIADEYHRQNPSWELEIIHRRVRERAE